jgi:serine/threonine-protein kinase
MSWKKELWPEWKVESEIGAGAFGKVYKIKRQDIGGTYYAALKVISVPGSEDEINILRSENMQEEQITEYYHRFANELSREFSLMERLKGNTNIVSYEDHKIVPRENGIGWDVLIRMELLTPLLRHLDQNGCNEQDAIQLGIDICNALILCERENILHRDIKPGNIFVSNYGDYKLGDFSIALTMSRSRMEYSPRGTYLYMAPEVYMGKRYDHTIDTYSLGLILYRLLNGGRAPFLPLPPETLTPEMIETANKKRLQGGSLPKPADASAGMAAIILKACAYEPGNRYQAAREFQKALERCQAIQGPLKVQKQVTQYIKKAVIAIQEMDGDTEALFNPRKPKVPPQMVVEELDEETDRIFPNRNREEKVAPSQRVTEKKQMNDFFSAAGDL